jgi:hypothetical protein
VTLCSGDASFNNTTFRRRVAVGPLRVAGVCRFDDANIEQDIQLEVSAAALSCCRTRFGGRATLSVLWAEVALDDATFFERCSPPFCSWRCRFTFGVSVPNSRMGGLCCSPRRAVSACCAPHRVSRITRRPVAKSLKSRCAFARDGREKAASQEVAERGDPHGRVEEGLADRHERTMTAVTVAPTPDEAW